ncbi:MAG: endonuclease/exonuclease/phosphatase family protein [Solirubrobacterales bacterium]
MRHFRTTGSFTRNGAKLFLATLLMLLIGLQVSVSAADPQTVSEPNLVVMTFNIRYGNANDGENSWANRKDIATDVIRRHSPDVIGLQEALRSQIDDIRAALPQYAEIGVGRDDGKIGGEYSAILYRKDRLNLDDSGTFWLSDTPEIPGSITWGNNCTRLCTWGRFLRKDSDEAFYLFNTHLDHISQYSRDRAAVLLAQRIRDRKHPDPVLLTGDFNTHEDNPVVRYFKGGQELPATDAGLAKNPVVLVDTFRVLHSDEQDTATFHGFKGAVAGSKIDYILAQPDTKVLRAEILRDNKDGRYPSDHFPMIAAVVLPNATSAR